VSVLLLLLLLTSCHEKPVGDMLSVRIEYDKILLPEDFEVIAKNKSRQPLCLAQGVHWPYEDVWGKGPYSIKIDNVEFASGILFIPPFEERKYLLRIDTFFAKPSHGHGTISFFYCKNITSKNLKKFDVNFHINL
jgi:hypothetical protein